MVVTRDAKGKVKLHQPVNLTAAGAFSGTFWGSLIGLLFLNPLLDGLKAFIGKAKVLRTSLTKDKEEELRRALEGASGNQGTQS